MTHMVTSLPNDSRIREVHVFQAGAMPGDNAVTISHGIYVLVGRRVYPATELTCSVVELHPAGWAADAGFWRREVAGHIRHVRRASHADGAHHETRVEYRRGVA